MLYRNLALPWAQRTESWLRCSAQKDLNTPLYNQDPVAVVCLIWPWDSFLSVQDDRTQHDATYWQILYDKLYIFELLLCWELNVLVPETIVLRSAPENTMSQLITSFVPSEEEAVELEHHKLAESETATSVLLDSGWQTCTWHQFWRVTKVIYLYCKCSISHYILHNWHSVDCYLFSF